MFKLRYNKNNIYKLFFKKKKHVRITKNYKIKSYWFYKKSFVIHNGNINFFIKRMQKTFFNKSTKYIKITKHIKPYPFKIIKN